ncbi:MAG: adenylate/guanylate cyclase domain-containing protein [Smithellaceae bacterium]|nr:adenylate/guanylate cyclase domain-containing protein [Smithellaceae bacterium]
MKPPNLIAKLSNDLRDKRLSDSSIIDYLDSIAKINDDRIHKKLLEELIRQYVILEKRVDSLLKNTLPERVANEIKYGGWFPPRPYDCTILFSDIVGFTGLAERIPGDELIGILDRLFKEIDDLVVSFRGTKIKTIGDAYMAVFGAPCEDEGHAVMAVKTGLELVGLVDSFNRGINQRLRLRIGIHSGKVMAGVVGKERMQFDVFGDNVNIAARFESAGEAGKVNVSHATYIKTNHRFEFEERGEIALKNKADMKAYFVLGER